MGARWEAVPANSSRTGHHHLPKCTNYIGLNNSESFLSFIEDCPGYLEPAPYLHIPPTISSFFFWFLSHTTLLQDIAIVVIGSVFGLAEA